MSKRKTAIVTGASKGIGKSIALKLAEENYDVFIFGRDERKLKSVKKNIIKLGANSEFYSGDVSDQEFVKKSVIEIIKRNKKIDVLINNAGIAYFEKFVDSTLEHFTEQISTNVIGVYNFSKAVIENMLKNKNGTILNIVSQAGKFGFQYGTTYAATKHAVMGLSKSLHLEVRKSNIRVITICPGSVETEMVVGSPIHQNIKQMLKPNDIAKVVISAIKLPKNALISDLDIRTTNP